MSKCISIYRQLRSLPYKEIFGLAKKFNVIEDFRWGEDNSGELYVSIEDMRGVRVTYYQWSKEYVTEKHTSSDFFSFVVTECCSRLAAYPQLLRYAEVCGLKLEGSPYYCHYDFKLVSKFSGIDKTIEVKCREDEKYNMEYFTENDAMLDEPKKTNATHYYTQTADGYGMLFDMRSGKPGSAVTKTSTAVPTDEGVNKDALYFNYKDNVYNWTPWCVASKRVLGLCS